MTAIGGRKYGNKKVSEDGYTFDSKAEWRRYRELKLMEGAEEITELMTHPRYDLWVGDTKICVYVADFSYNAGGRHVVEDVKGVKTAAYRIKKKLMLGCLGIAVVEVEA